MGSATYTYAGRYEVQGSLGADVFGAGTGSYRLFFRARS